MTGIISPASATRLCEIEIPLHHSVNCGDEASSAVDW